MALGPQAQTPRDDFRFKEEIALILADILLAILALATGSAGATGSELVVPITLTSSVFVTADSDTKEFIIINNTNQVLHLSYSSTASISSTILLSKGDGITDEIYKGVVSGVWLSTSGGGDARVTIVTT